MGVPIVSYAGALNFGVTGDYETAPDIQVLCDGISELLATASARQPGRPRPSEDDKRAADRHAADRP